MAKQDLITLIWLTLECLPNATFKVKIEDENFPELELLCHLSWKMKMNRIGIIPWDRVKVELTTYDLSKWRITYRFKKWEKINPELWK
jgi:translation initiation factor IF-1